MSIQSVTSSMVASKCNRNNTSFTSKEPQKSQQPQNSSSNNGLSLAIMGLGILGACMIHHNYSKIGELSEKFESGMKSLKDDLKSEIDFVRTCVESDALSIKSHIATVSSENFKIARKLEDLHQDVVMPRAEETVERVEKILQDMDKSKGVVKD